MLCSNLFYHQQQKSRVRVYTYYYQGFQRPVQESWKADVGKVYLARLDLCMIRQQRTAMHSLLIVVVFPWFLAILRTWLQRPESLRASRLVTSLFVISISPFSNWKTFQETFQNIKEILTGIGQLNEINWSNFLWTLLVPRF